MDYAVVIDGLSLIFKNFHALIDLKNQQGYGTGAAFGIVKSLLYLFTKYRWVSSGVILSWDRKPKWKYDLFPGYKAKRKQMDLSPKMAVPVQLKIAHMILDSLGINQAQAIDMESDDVCATLAKKLSVKRKVVIVTADHDLNQCLSDKICVLHHGKHTERMYKMSHFLNDYGIYPEDYWKVQTLGGCTTDKVPGMVGISEDTAVKIIKANSWADILNNNSNLVFPTTRSQTVFRKKHKEWDHRLMKKLVYLRTDLKPTIEIKKLDEHRLRKLFVALGFKQYLLPDNFHRIVEVFSRIRGDNGE